MDNRLLYIVPFHNLVLLNFLNLKGSIPHAPKMLVKSVFGVVNGLSSINAGMRDPDKNLLSVIFPTMMTNSHGLKEDTLK